MDKRVLKTALVVIAAIAVYDLFIKDMLAGFRK